MNPNKGFVAAVFSILLVLAVSSQAAKGKSKQISIAANATTSRRARLFSPLQIVRFHNSPCNDDEDDSGKVGTCYTAAECEAVGGEESGTCADGFGVCCIKTIHCGERSDQNCTYFDSEDVKLGACRAEICPATDNICQLRLDFNTFTTTGPATSADPVAKTTGGVSGAGVKQSAQSQCLTDTFSVTNPGGNAPPVICGLNTNMHMYVDASPSCNSLLFQLGSETAQWSIKVTQYSCHHPNLAPQGCTQYFYNLMEGEFQSYNYQTGAGQIHQLANQRESYCFRREINQCRICFLAEVDTNFDVSGSTGTVTGINNGLTCCGISSEGIKGFDCIQIPNAEKNDPLRTPLPTAICGNKGLLTDAGAMTYGPVCTTTTPFRLNYLTDNWEGINTGMAEGVHMNRGFRLRYFMDRENCGSA